MYVPHYSVQSSLRLDVVWYAKLIPQKCTKYVYPINEENYETDK